MTNALAVVKRHFPIVIGVGGAVMIVLGLLILTGEFTTLNSKPTGCCRAPGWTCPTSELGWGEPAQPASPPAESVADRVRRM